MNLGSRLVPSDVREVIDRADTKLDAVIQGLSIVGSLLSEQNSLLAEQNKLLRGPRSRS
jgi:hypothetical protein